MKTDVTEFVQDESGAITVDWVVLAAGVMGVALMVITLSFGGANEGAAQIGYTLSSLTVGV